MPRAFTTANSISTLRHRPAAARRCLPISATDLRVLPASIAVGQPIAHRLDHMLSGVRAQIALKIYGDDYDTLRALAAELETRLKSVRGITDLQTEKQVRIPQLQVSVDYDKAKRYGLNPNDITHGPGDACQMAGSSRKSSINRSASTSSCG